MLECIVSMFIMGYNPHTTELKQLYRCKNESSFRYLDSDKIAYGYYSINDEVTILKEGYGI